MKEARDGWVRRLAAPLPFDEADRIVGIRNRDVAERRTQIRALHDFFVWREELTSFEGVAAARTDPYNVISDDGRAAPVRGSEITAAAFRILRVPPLMGRALVEADEVPGAPDVVVLSHAVWQSRLAGDPDAVGRTIRIGTTPHEVVGVMPEGFLFPMRDQLWLPLRDRPTDFERGMGPDVITFGRLADGVSLEEARAELETVEAFPRALSTGLTMVVDHGQHGAHLRMMKEPLEVIAISKFKATCLAVLERVRRTGMPVLVTKRGEPIARIVPPPPHAHPDSWIGSLRELASPADDLIDPVSTSDEWEAVGP